MRVRHFLLLLCIFGTCSIERLTRSKDRSNALEQSASPLTSYIVMFCSLI